MKMARLRKRTTRRSRQREEKSLTTLVRRGELFTIECPSREVLKHVTSLWGVLCLIALRDGRLRFSELRRKVGTVSDKMLAKTLKRLEDDGFVRRTPFPVVPPHVEYDLTPLGEEAAEQVAALADWIEVNVHRVMKARTTRDVT